MQDWGEPVVAPSVIEPETFGTEDEDAPTVLWVPTAHAMRGEEVPPLALRATDDDRPAMLVFTSEESFARGCGDGQPYISIVAEAVHELQAAVGADELLWDPVLDPALWQQGEHHPGGEE